MSLMKLMAHLIRTCVFLVNFCKQSKQSPDCLACLKRCLACILRNLSHLNSLCDPLHKEHISCVATLEQDLITLFPVDCDEREMLGTNFCDWVVWSSSWPLHFDSRNMTNTAFVGVSDREAFISYNSRCVSGSSVASIIWFNINSCTGTFNDKACKPFMCVDTWLNIWRNVDASHFLTWGHLT